jgi:hypothetical protein
MLQSMLNHLQIDQRPAQLQDSVYRSAARPVSILRQPTVLPAPYEADHSERQATGSVSVGEGRRWLATLSVPMTGDQSLLLSIERDGPLPAGAPEVEAVSLVIPAGEVDAFLTLLHGVVAHARRDGVLGRKTYR